MSSQSNKLATQLALVVDCFNLTAATIETLSLLDFIVIALSCHVD